MMLEFDFILVKKLSGVLLWRTTKNKFEETLSNEKIYLHSALFGSFAGGISRKVLCL
jgi:hypothetical protein